MAVLSLLIGPRWLATLVLVGIMAVLITGLVDGALSWSVLGPILLLAVAAALRGVAIGVSIIAGVMRWVAAGRR